MKLRVKIEVTVEKRKERFKFLMGFVRLVKRLLTFIEAVRSQDWDLYLSSFDEGSTKHHQLNDAYIRRQNEAETLQKTLKVPSTREKMVGK